MNDDDRSGEMSQPTINETLQRAFSDVAKGARSFATHAREHVNDLRERIAGLDPKSRDSDSDG